MKTKLSALALFLAGICTAQTTVVTFEDFNLEIDDILNNSGEDYQFVAENIIFPNEHFEWGTTHWSISADTDNETIGFMNQYSSIIGGGEASETYAVCNIPFTTNQGVVRFVEPTSPVGFSVTNGTYGYFSMLLGDDIGKKFGGETGDDPDFFDLKIQGYSDGDLLDEELTIKLADYTFENNDEDYILDGWLDVDLTGFGVVDSLVFTMNSSDVGEFGMNTPAYFCIDNFEYSSTLSVDEQSLELNVYPNPTVDLLYLSENIQKVKAFNQQGVLVKEEEMPNKVIDVSNLPAGVYFFQFFLNEQLKNAQIIIH